MIRPGMVAGLRYLADNEGQATIDGLAEALGWSRGSAATIPSLFRRQALITMEPRRIETAALTAKGRKLLAKEPAPSAPSKASKPKRAPRSQVVARVAVPAPHAPPSAPAAEVALVLTPADVEGELDEGLGASLAEAMGRALPKPARRKTAEESEDDARYGVDGCVWCLEPFEEGPTRLATHLAVDRHGGRDRVCAECAAIQESRGFRIVRRWRDGMSVEAPYCVWPAPCVCNACESRRRAAR